MSFSHEKIYNYIKSCVLHMLLTINSQLVFLGGVGMSTHLSA